VDVLAVRPQVMQTHAGALRYLIAGHFAAQAFLRTNPQQAAQWMAPRLQTPAQSVADVLHGLLLPDAAQNVQIMRSGSLLDTHSPNPRSYPLAQPLLRNRSDWNALVDTQFLPT